ncbi:hypothetical protein PHLH3_08230 [Pseudomonas sp. St386]|uniref:hypothetical protein n=1 Tax=Pseudomonas sp. St386 TaxID=2678256 RepID=UPI001BB3CAEE|nr:hypothetical protein [Pseudomonas sp. St386]BBP51197.1 hypothetical protein PHLH3_08230 [Pseudomonas sp. St386]
MESVKRISVLWPVGPYGYGREQVVLASEFDRVSAENLALQQRLTVQDQREDDLKGLLAVRDDLLQSISCLGVFGLLHDDLKNRIKACVRESQSAQLRAALNPASEAEPNCLLCLDKKTVPGNIHGGFVKDCPDCCGEEG